jgi:tetratricopeptide (TPR) repeat protein
MAKKFYYCQQFWICLALTLVTAAVYCQVYSYDFVNYDDPVYVYENSNIQSGLTPVAVKWAFTSGYAANWHPLTWLSHMLDWQLFGSNAAGHHITNLIFHIANTLLLFIVLKQMTGALWPSAFVAALFALHPLHVESVAWVSERKDVLSTFFWILTMWAYVRFVRRPKIWRYLLVMVFFALGLMSKPMLVTLPFVLLLLDYWPLDRIPDGQAVGKSKGRNKNRADSRFQWRALYHLIWEKIPLFVLSAASSIITFFVQQRSGAVAMLVRFPLRIRICNAFISYVEYIAKMIWPGRLAALYPLLGRNVSVLYVTASIAFLLAVTIAILRFSKNRRYLVTGWFWYLGTLVPVIGLVQVGDQALADRYSYITLTGLFIIIAWGLPELLGKWPHRKVVLCWTSSLIVLSALAVCTHLQQRYWKDTITLFDRALKVTNNNYRAHFYMVRTFFRQNRIEDVIRHSTEAIRIYPDYVEALNSLGVALQKTGRIDEAIVYYKKAIEVNPQIPYAHNNLGIALAYKGKFAEAVEHYKIAVKTMDTPQIHKDFGYALLKLGRFGEAIAEYHKVLSVIPNDPDVLNKIGYALTRMGKLDEAIAYFNQALKIDPNHTAARENLAVVLAEKRKLQNAENPEE